MADLISQIIDFAQNHPQFSRSDLHSHFKSKFSKGYLSEQLTILTSQNKLIRMGGSKYVVYALPNQNTLSAKIWTKRYKNQALNEDSILSELKQQSNLFSTLCENVRVIFDYAFTEMVNNAIDHSQSKLIDFNVLSENGNLVFQVHDYGIGVFQNLMSKKQLPSELAAIQDLLKGKQTTAPEYHSGEGIFFTSKAADLFELSSFGLKLRIDNLISDVFIEEISPSLSGTSVNFQINLNSDKQLIDIFKNYQTDPSTYAFDRTEVKIKLYLLGTSYISRSQAKRVLAGLEKFKHIVLDFMQVPTVGQAFADEIFRVFKSFHPDVEITAINMIEPVEFMIKRVKSGNTEQT